MREFQSGATRSSDLGKYDYEGFLSPLVLEAFAAYMHINRTTEDGGTRDSDNWQKGMPRATYVKSGLRHFHDLWKAQRGLPIAEGELAAAMGTIFNVMGWTFERMREDPTWFDRELEKYRAYRAQELEARRQAKP